MAETPEAVALDLLRIIAVSEDKTIAVANAPANRKPDRQWVLDTYAECLRATQGARAMP